MGGRHCRLRSGWILACLAVCANFAPLIGAEGAAEANGGFGINLYGPKDWNRTQPFLNVMKTARSWISQSASAWDDGRELALDDHGYVTALQPGQWAATLMLTEVGAAFPGGEYVFLYDGDGDFAWKGHGRLVSAAPGRQVVEVTPGEQGFVHLVITRVDPENYPRHMRFVKAEFEQTFETQPFAPWFLDLWIDARTIRFMDWALANNSRLSEWRDRPMPADRTYSQQGVALEEIIRLCNQTGKNPWINLPHLATDEYIRETAAMLRDRLDPGLTVYYEFSNEVWNGMFAQTRHANAEGKRLGLAPEEWKAGLMFYAQQSKRMFALLDEVYAGQPRERYRKVLASQAANLGVSQIVAESFGVAKQADCLAIAPYLTFNIPLERNQWNPLAAAEVAAWDLDQLFAHLNEKALPQCLRWMDQQKALADQFGLELVAYEGGQHLTALGEANKNKVLIDLFNRANRDPRMGEIYTQYLGHWTNIGGGLFCLFNDMQPYSVHGAWGLLEFVGQDPATSPKYMAVKTWAKGLGTPDAGRGMADGR
jgi:hypothetical protein